MWVERTWFESIDEHEGEDILSNYPLWLNASVSLIFCPNNFINHYCIALH
jgi:hypothetical protein